MPFSVGNETGRVAAAVALQLQVDTARVVRPRAELQLVVMVREILADRQTDHELTQYASSRTSFRTVGRRTETT